MTQVLDTVQPQAEADPQEHVPATVPATDGEAEVNAGRNENIIADRAKADDALNLEAIGRKVVALDKQAFQREVGEAKASASIIELIASILPVSTKLKLKVVAGWIRDARKGAGNYASTTTYLQDPTKATAPERHKQGSDNYRQLAYRRMNLARITAAVQGRLSPKGKSLWRKSENPENLVVEHAGQKMHGVTIINGSEVLCYATPIDMLRDGYTVTTTLRMWMDALRPKVVNLRDRAERPTATQVQEVVEKMKAPAKVQETTKDGEIIEKTRNITIVSDADLLGQAMSEMLAKAIEFQYGPRWQESGVLDTLSAALDVLLKQHGPAQPVDLVDLATGAAQK